MQQRVQLKGVAVRRGGGRIERLHQLLVRFIKMQRLSVVLVFYDRFTELEVFG